MSSSVAGPRARTASASKHPKLGGLILAVSDTPQSTNAWDTGAIGEERLGARLNELASDSLRVLHDRRIPKSRANIDHLAITPSGVFVIDAKKYKGRPDLQVEGGILRPRVEKLMVGKRDRTSLVDGVLKQVQTRARHRRTRHSRDGRAVLRRSRLAPHRWRLLDPGRGGHVAQEALQGAGHGRSA